MSALASDVVLGRQAGHFVAGAGQAAVTHGMHAGGQGGVSLVAAGDSTTYHPNVFWSNVLTYGIPTRADLFGSLAFTNFPQRDYRVRLKENFDEHLEVLQLDRGFQDPYRHRNFKQTSRIFRMAFWGIKAGWDVRYGDTIDDFFDLELEAVALAVAALQLSQENEKATLLADPAKWPAGHAIDAVANPWDTPVTGDSKADIEAAIAQVQSVHPWATHEMFQVVLTQGAWDAVVADPTWLAARQTDQISHPYPSLRLYQEYIFGADSPPDSIVIRESLHKERGGQQESLWGDFALVRVRDDGLPGIIDTTRGGVFFARQHIGPPLAFPTWFDNDRTTRWRPIDARELAVVHDYTAAVGIFNVKA